MAIRVLKKPNFHVLCESIFKPTPKFANQILNQFSTNPKKPPALFPQKNNQRSLISLSSLFQRYGFSPSQLHSFLKSNHFLLDLNPSDVEKSLKILLSLKPSQEFLASVVYGCPSVLELEFLRNWEKGFSELGLSSISSVAIQNILQVSRSFDLSSGDVYKRIMWLKGYGFSESTVISILEACPMVLMMNEDSIICKMRFLMDIGIGKKDIDPIFGLFPSFLAFEVGNKIKPLFDEFQDLGFSFDMVRREVIRDPRILGLEVGELSHCLKMLRSLKCRVPIKDSIFRNGMFRAGYEVKLRVDCLRRYGLTYRDAFTVLWKEPRTILYDVEDIEKKIEFLVHTMKFNVLCLVQVPEYLGVNFEKNIVPRFNVIEYLRSRGGLGDDVGLRDLIRPSRLRFYNLYVKPYPECEKMYGRFSGESKVRSRHPVGMWKHFKPQQYQQSEEDVKNIQSFVESLA